MSSTEAIPMNAPGARGRASQNYARYFYSVAALVLFVLAIVGFQQFYFHGRAYPGRELTPPIRTLIILHGVSMLAWMVLFVLQPFLVAAGKRRVHMMLGRFGAVVAVAVVAFGLLLGVSSARVTPPEFLLWGLAPKQFLAVSFFSIILFGVFVAVGIWKRKHREVHRPMMLLAVLAAMPAALDRIDVLRNLYAETVFGALFGPFFSMLVIGFTLLAIHSVLTRSVSHSFAIGYGVLVAFAFLVMRIAPTDAWAAFARFLTG